MSNLDEADVTPDLEYYNDDDEDGIEGSPDTAPPVPSPDTILYWIFGNI